MLILQRELVNFLFLSSTCKVGIILGKLVFSSIGASIQLSLTFRLGDTIGGCCSVCYMFDTDSLRTAQTACMSGLRKVLKVNGHTVVPSVFCTVGRAADILLHG